MTDRDDAPQPDPASAAARPFRVLGVQQVALGGERKADLRALWVDLLGLEAIGSFRSERENVDEDILVCGAGVAKVEIDLMEPIDPERSPKVHVPPLNQRSLEASIAVAAV